MVAEQETFVVRFSNRAAVQRFQEARELLKEAISDSPWNDTLLCIQTRLDEAWEGLTFGLDKERQHGEEACGL